MMRSPAVRDSIAAKLASLSPGSVSTGGVKAAHARWLTPRPDGGLRTHSGDAVAAPRAAHAVAVQPPAAALATRARGLSATPARAPPGAAAGRRGPRRRRALAARALRHGRKARLPHRPRRRLLRRGRRQRRLRAEQHLLARAL